MQSNAIERKMRNKLLAEKFSPLNGSTFEDNGIFYEIFNTCTIDYFILILAIISENNLNMSKAIESNKNELLFYSLCSQIHLFVLENNWNFARLS